MDHSISEDRRGPGTWRVIGWGGAAALLIVPAVAMRFTRQVNWTAFDFAFAATMLLIFGGLFELAVRARGEGRRYRIGVGLALLASFLLIWINGAVGIVGNEDNPFNLAFGLPILAMISGAIASRGSGEGLARSAWLAAALQALIGIVALNMDVVIVPATLVFCGLWVSAALLLAARKAD